MNIYPYLSPKGSAGFQMLTSSNGHIFRITGPMCGEFTPYKGQWRGTLIFYLMCAWTNGWVSTRDASDLRRNRAHYNITVMRRGLLAWSAWLVVQDWSHSLMEPWWLFLSVKIQSWSKRVLSCVWPDCMPLSIHHVYFGIISVSFVVSTCHKHE